MHTLSPGWLPFIFFHEEQVISVTRKAGDLLFLYVYFIPESPENGKGKKVLSWTEMFNLAIISMSYTKR